MSILNNLLEQYTWIETILYIIGPSIVIAAVILYVLLAIKSDQIKKLQKSLKNLQKTYNDLDNQAKIIIKTDLELHKTQSELDKKITGLYTLQKISRILSTTLDENEIFEKISEEYLTELEFDKAISFLIDPTQFTSLENNLDVKLKIGYNEKEIKEIFTSEFAEDIFGPVIKKAAIISSLDPKTDPKKLNSIIKICKINSFICAPISIKEGIIGVLFVGSESSYSPITLGDKEIVSILATQIGQSLENARLFEETWRSQQELEIKVKQRTKELSEALEEIKIITKRKSDFVSAVSHELRTPLTSIKGYAALLSAGKLGEISTPVKERLEKINKHSDGLSQLINNILDISRIESGRVEMKIEDINLKDLLDSLADLFTPQFKEKQIDFRQELPENLNTMPADKNQLQRVFINLIGNALKFTPAKGKITVRIKKINEFIQIDVEDTGKGIAEKNLNKIFEEFYREDNEVNQNVKGTGLGLSLVKYIVEAHKGKIWVNSKLNQGTTFSFTFPAVRNQRK
ncbi:MAG: GAF domain-containing protein [Candidatus Omnitrophica bacterium]|nr:GAF domain-containing protein [Candidatus Omnitrophota bacterium]